VGVDQNGLPRRLRLCVADAVSWSAGDQVHPPAQHEILDASQVLIMFFILSTTPFQNIVHLSFSTSNLIARLIKTFMRNKKK
jgi:hypothetical protein